MALLQISEPGQSVRDRPRRRVVGIDLGTTNSLVATVRVDAPETLTDVAGAYLLPSVVHYVAGQAPVVGEAAKAFAAADPTNTIASVKRLMGRGVDDLQTLGTRLPYEFVASASGMPLIHTAAGNVSPVEVSAEILRELRLRAVEQLGGELFGAVITVPAYFDDAQRQATKDAARIAGLEVMRLLNEPTAAAVAYGLDRGVEGIHVIYDLGGGTFDISVLRFSRGVFEVLATAGDSALGGDDMDRVVAQWLMREASIPDDASRGQLRRLLERARAAKEALSAQAQVNIELDLGEARPWSGSLDRERFDALVEPIVRRTLGPCRRALRDAGIGVTDVQSVVLVGGATRVPCIRAVVAEFFGREPLVDIDPEKVVSLGAAIQADILAGHRPDDATLLLDVIPLSLGLETMGGLVEKIIPRNTAIPACKAQDFTTFKDGQTALSIHVVQGERDLVKDCRSLARFELRGIPPMAAGAARVRVTFQVDADGLLTVSSEELTSGQHSAIEVKPSYGLTHEEIEVMLLDSISHAEDDVDARRLRESQVEAEQLAIAVQAALDVDADGILNAEERGEIEAALERLDAARSGRDPRLIRRAVEAVNEATLEFAKQRMDKQLRAALSGRPLGDFE